MDLLGFCNVLLLVLMIALGLAFWRLVIGPGLTDRVVALEVIAAIGVATAGVYAIGYRNAVYLDVAIVLALISFVGTVAFAQFLEKRVGS